MPVEKTIPPIGGIEEYIAIYDTIELNLIAKKFGVDEDTVENILLKLIQSGRIRGTLTSANGVKTFVHAKEPVKVSTDAVIISRKVEGKIKYFSVPTECPHCGQFLTAEDYTWADMMKVKCKYCGGVIEVETKEF